jgi:peptidoglycan/LPS O-acetylase OafA/YrhL
MTNDNDQPAHTSSSHEYRPDVDGLRALAVLAVLGFHAFPEAVPGGFVGVDVFFVVSGFLISGIILGDLNAGKFSFFRFYDRRIRRIFPALALVLAACLIYGWWALLPFDFRQLGAQVAAGAGFVSNILLWEQSGYFDRASELKPLLHLWSLGVEEQYYLIWPLVLYLFRRSIRSLLWVIVAIAAASFALNIFATARYPTAAFYLPPTRFWELMLGSIIAYLKLYPTRFDRSAPIIAAVAAPLARSAASLIGLALIGTAIGILDQSYAFPGWWALLPTVGTVLVITAGSRSWINRHILADKRLVYVGLISYPLYLWHWPILVYLRIFSGGDPSVPARVAALLSSGVLAALTYELIEKKIRRARLAAPKLRPAPVLATLIALLGAFGLLVFGNHARARSNSVPHLAKISAAFSDWTYGGEQIIRGNTGKAVLFFGDSHMEQYLPRIEQLMRDPHAKLRTVIIRTRHGCAPIPLMERTGRHCSEFVADGFRRAHAPDVESVVIAASWVGFTDRTDSYQVDARRGSRSSTQPTDIDEQLRGFEAALKDLVTAGKHVVIILSSLRGDQFDPRNMVRRVGFQYQVNLSPPVPRIQIEAANAFIDDRLREIAARVGAELVDPLDYLCTMALCPTTTDDGRPLLMDESHLRSSIVRQRFNALDRYVFVGLR